MGWTIFEGKVVTFKNQVGIQFSALSYGTVGMRFTIVDITWQIIEKRVQKPEKPKSSP